MRLKGHFYRMFSARRAAFFILPLIIIAASPLFAGEADAPTTPSAPAAALRQSNQPLEILITGRQADDNFKVETILKNLSEKPLSGMLQWQLRPRGRVEIPPQPFYDLMPNDELTTSSSLLAGSREGRLFAAVEIPGERRIENSIGLMPMPLRMAAPKLDGCLSEWMDVPILKLSSIRQSAELYHAFQFWWTEDALYIAAYIRDEDAQTRRRMDFYFALDGPSRRKRIGARDFRIELCPVVESGFGSIAICGSDFVRHAGAGVLQAQADGFIIEARVPISELGGWKPQRRAMIGFNLVLDEETTSASRLQRDILRWNGSSEEYTQPLHWGLAIIY